MATLTVNGRKVTVDDSFRNLSPEQQEATVNEIAQSMNEPGASFQAFGGMDKAIAEKGRGALDKLFGLTGPRYQTWPERAVREVAGTPKELIDAAASAQPGSQELSENLVGPAAKTAMLASPRPAAMKAPPQAATIPTAREIREAADQGFDATRKSDVLIDPSALARQADDWLRKLDERGFRDRNAPDTRATIAELLNPPGGTVGSSISNLQTLRESLGNIAFDKRGTSEAKAANSAIRSLEAYLSRIPQRDVLAGDARAASKTLSEAIQNYAASKKSQQITGEVEAANVQAAAANSGLNAANRTRQRMASILVNDLTGSGKKAAGFRPNEIAQIERIAGGTMAGNAARHAGNLAGGGGGLGQVASVGVGAHFGGTEGAMAAVGAGVLGRMLHDRSTQRQARILDEMIRSRAPLAKERMDEAPGLLASQQSRAEQIARLLTVLQAADREPERFQIAR